MERRGRDLLSAEARFLADFCGEDAVRRWRARLSDAERDQLIPVLDVVQELCRALIGSVRHIVQEAVAAVSALLRPIFRLLDAVHALMTGQDTRMSGFQAP